MTGFWMGLSTFFLVFVGFLLMFIVLLQRGRGGGLAGAFGGLGGQSAFGTKAGDVFTKITVVLAVIWVVLAGVTGFAMRSAAEGQYKGGAAVIDRPTLESAGDEGAGAEIPQQTPEQPSPFDLGTGREGGAEGDAFPPAKPPAKVTPSEPEPGKDEPKSDTAPKNGEAGAQENKPDANSDKADPPPGADKEPGGGSGDAPKPDASAK